MLALLRRLMRNDDGMSVIEYGLIVSLIAVAAISGMKTVGKAIGNVLVILTNAMN